MNQKVKIRIDGEYSEEGEIGRGVRQGCPLSPLLFNIYIEELIQEAMEETEEGIKVGGRLIKALRFADDQAMLATTQEGLQRMMDQLNLTSGKYNMKINISKTKSMKIGREEEEGTAKIKINGEEVEQVEFQLLGNYDDSRCKVPK
jgi:retron-type reverse transcriptase